MHLAQEFMRLLLFYGPSPYSVHFHFHAFAEYACLEQPPAFLSKCSHQLWHEFY